MPLKDTPLEPSRIISETKLINTCLQKENNLSFFLGAGCSKECGIPLGWEVSEICQKYSFVNQNDDANDLCLNENFHNYELMKEDIDKFITEYQIEYEQFVTETETEFKNKVKDDYFINKIPKHFKVKNLLKQEYDEKEMIELIFEDSKYGEWFEKYGDTPRERQRLIEFIIEKKTAYWSYVFLAHLVKEKFIKNIFTTNFDDLINEALMYYYNVRARVFSHNEEAYYISMQSSKPNIIKLHGDYLFENLKNTGEETSRLDTNMEEKFGEALKQRSGLVVIGYGGADNSIMSILYEMKKHGYSLYWCDKDINKLHWRVKDLLNNTKFSHFIEINSFEDFISKLWNKSKLEPINIADNANKRQKEYEDYVNKISDVENKSKNQNQFKAFEHLNIGNNYKKLKDYKKSLEEYSKAIAIKPDFAEAYFEKGIVFYKMLNYEKALEEFNKVLRIDKKYPFIHLYIGNAYSESYNLEEAIKNYELALIEAPMESIIYDNMALAYGRLKNFVKMFELYDKSLKLDPTNYTAYAFRARAYCDLGEYYEYKNDSELSKSQYQKALYDAETSIKLNSNYSIAHKNMGSVLEKLQKYDKSIKFYTQAIEINPEVPQTYIDRGLVYELIHDYENAEKDFKKAYQITKAYINYLLELNIITNNSQKNRPLFSDIQNFHIYQPFAKFMIKFHQAITYSITGYNYYKLIKELEDFDPKDFDFRWDPSKIQNWLNNSNLKNEKKLEIEKIIELIINVKKKSLENVVL